MKKSIRKAVRVFIVENSKIVAIRYNKGLCKDYYDLPGGKIEGNEISIETAVRETKEETGIDIFNPKYVGNAIIEYPSRIFDFDLYLVTEYKGSPQNFSENNSMWINIDDLSKENKKLSSIQLIKYINENKETKIKMICEENHNVQVNNISI